MQTQYEADHSYRGYKETLWHLFLCKCEERSDEAIAAGFFRNKLKERIEMHVNTNTCSELKLYASKQLKTKKEFIKTILLDLSAKNDFEQ